LENIWGREEVPRIHGMERKIGTGYMKREMKVKVQVESAYMIQYAGSFVCSKPTEIQRYRGTPAHAHTVQLTRVNGRSRKFGVEWGTQTS
jgi:hypothetical protein